MANKRLLVKCDACGAELSKPPSLIHTRNYCNMRCLGDHRKLHPTTDASQMHTPESREKIRQARLSGDLSGSKNGMFGRKHTDVSKDKMSETRSQMVLDGRYPTYGRRHKKGYYSSVKTNREAFYRSGWELAMMKHLDADVLVETWEFETVRIQYSYNDHKRWYVPDFIVNYVDGTRWMFEIKPKEFVDTEKNRLKENAAIRHCEEQGFAGYCTLTGDELRAMKVI